MVEYFKKHTTHEEFHRINYTSEDIWIHLGAPTEDELQAITDTYHLDANIVNDVLDKSELSRCEFNNGVQYVFLRPAMRTRSGEVRSRPLLAILHPEVFITIATSKAVTAEEIARTGNKSIGLHTANRSKMLLVTIAAIVGEYETLVKHTDEYIGTIRKKLRSHEVGNKDFVHFVTIEDNLNEYQVCLRDTLAVTMRLKENTHQLFTDDQIEELDDIILYIRQLQSASASLTQTIGSIRNVYSTIANNTLNQRMKLLTALTVLIALPNVVYGMYGMNVPLPYQDEMWSYPIIVLFTFFIILLVYVIARRFKVF